MSLGIFMEACMRAVPSRVRTIAAMGLLTSGVLLFGCVAVGEGGGYKVGSLHDTSIRTISVPMFENRTYANGLEARLTEAIISEIQRVTPWQVVRSNEAQTTLQGVITDASLRALTTEFGYIEQQAYSITVDFSWVDNARGEPKLVRQNYNGLGTFVPVRDVGERIEVGQREAIRELARDIVQELQADW